jgi:peptidoglycan/xylan/chitin deacetylase (PgdA/CDA1 family)
VIENPPGTTTPTRPRHRERFGPQVRRRARRLLLRAAARRPARPGIRVLAYHLMPEASIFRAHVAAIRSVAEIVDERELLNALENPSALDSGETRVVMTFDDGYRQHLTDDALDVVEKLALRPTVFMLAAGVDRSLGRPQRLFAGSDPETLADAAELRAAVEAGWFVGSHTSTHWDCATGSADDLAREIGGSKSVLEACLGTEIRTFAFPWGKPENVSPHAYEAIRRSGYDAAFTTVRGCIARAPASVFDLPRDVVEDWWGPRELSGCLAGALDRFGVGS